MECEAAMNQPAETYTPAEIARAVELFHLLAQINARRLAAQRSA